MIQTVPIRLAVKAIKPGRLYAVSGSINMTIIARHPCEAAKVALRTMEGEIDGRHAQDRAQGAGLFPAD
jgi:hypothetical protein